MNTHTGAGRQFSRDAKVWQRHTVVAREGTFQVMGIVSVHSSALCFGCLHGTGNHQEIPAVGRPGARQACMAEPQETWIGVEIAR